LSPGPHAFTSCLERNFFLNLRMNEARHRIGKVFPERICDDKNEIPRSFGL
jgi:hypothetical protein